MLSLSIVIPVFNEDKFIKKNINSLLSNSSRDFEIIIFDNCSDDNTLNILESFNDARLKITKQPKKVSPAKNHKDAIKKARGSHIFLAGGDDFFHHEVFDKVIPFLEKDKITFCKMELVDTKNVNKVIGNQNTEGVIKNIFEVKTFARDLAAFSLFFLSKSVNKSKVGSSGSGFLVPSISKEREAMVSSNNLFQADVPTDDF